MGDTVSNPNDFTISDMKGEVDLRICLSTPDPEPIPHTVQRMVEGLQEENRLPANVDIVNIHASREVAGWVMCSVSYVVKL